MRDCVKTEIVNPDMMKVRRMLRGIVRGGYDTGGDCPICMESLNAEDTIEFSCAHKFCKTCVIQLLNRFSNPRCPYCRREIENLLDIKQTIGLLTLHDASRKNNLDAINNLV